MATLGMVTITCKLVEEKRLEALLEEAYRAGFKVSNTRWNGEQGDEWHALMNGHMFDSVGSMYADWREKVDA